MDTEKTPQLQMAFNAEDSSLQFAECLQLRGNKCLSTYL